MLRHLRVTNFAILSDVEMELGEGMNVLTGETGAGKSLIVEAVNLLRGGRASADIPRAGADEAVVEAIFEVPEDLRDRIYELIDGAGLPRGDGEEVFIRRVIQRATPASAESKLEARPARRGEQGGRSRTYVNGALTTAARLAELGALLVDLSGQHQHQGLVDPSRHLEIIDAFAGHAKDGLVAAMTAAWAELRECDLELAALGGDEREREARVDYLRFQLDELEGAALAPDEDTAIELERSRLASVDQLQSAVRGAEELIYGGDDSARDRVAAAVRELERVLKADPGLEPVARQLAEIESLLDDAADQLRAYADKLEGDPERLAYLDERLALIRRLIRKHCSDPRSHQAGTLAQVLAKATELRTELDALTSRDSKLAELAARRTKTEAAAIAAAAALTKSRTRAAKRLEKEVGGALAELGMASARLSVVVEPRALGPAGSDRVELMLASNKGEDMRPLTKVASGGELSRIMLALKLGLQSAGKAEDCGTFVFDEVDTGIGGATAQVVGSQIRAVADHRQVLCVTHLPQIAAFADHHFHVQKTELGGRTETHVKKLNAAARKDELARMLGGSATSKARAHAAELLSEAAKPRKSASARA